MSGVSNFFSDATQSVGDAFAGLDKGVRDAVPGGWGSIAILVAAAVTMQPELAGSLMAEDTVGTVALMDAEGAAQAMGYESVSEALANGVAADAFGLPASATVDSIGAMEGSLQTANEVAQSMGYLDASDAMVNGQVQLADLGLSDATNVATGEAINLPFSPQDVGLNYTSDIATGVNGTGTGITSGAVDAALQSGSAPLDASQILSSAGQGALKGAATNAIVSGLTGNQITPKGLLTSAALGGLGGAVSPAISGALPADTNPIIPGALTGATVGATGSLLSGTNPLTGAGVGGVLGGVTAGLTKPDVTGTGDAPILNSMSPTPSQTVNTGLLGAALGATKGLLTGSDVATSAELGGVGGVIGSLGSQGANAVKSGLPDTTTATPTTTADTSNMVPVTLADGSTGYLGGNNQVYNADGTLNGSETAQLNVAMGNAGTQYAPVASANVDSGTASDVGGTNTPLVTSGNAPTKQLTPEELSSFDAPVGSYFGQDGNVYNADGTLNRFVVTGEIPTTTNLGDVGIGGVGSIIGGGGNSSSGGGGNSSSGGGNSSSGGSGGSDGGGGSGGTDVSNTGSTELPAPLSIPNLVSPSTSSVAGALPSTAVAPTQTTQQQQQKQQTSTSNPLEALLYQGQQINLPSFASNIPVFSYGAKGYADGGGIGTDPMSVPPQMPSIPGMPAGHNPKFFSEGGLNSIKHRYVTGAGDGTSDSIPAMLANGEFVIPADVVSSLGNGSNDSGAKILDEFLKTIRAHKHKHDAKSLPPDSKGPLGYLLEAKRKVRK